MSREGVKYYGIYRGIVVDNVDPEQIGRISAEISDVLGKTPSTWALPAVPVAGKNMCTFMVPEIGALVWIQFEAGDPDHPVWTGGWWGAAKDVPRSALFGNPESPNILLQTVQQNSIMISDLPPNPALATAPARIPLPTGGIVLRSRTGAMIVVNDAGIFINNGKGATVELVGDTVRINKTALVVV